MTPTQLATVLNVNLNTMKVHLMRLTERGLVAKDGQGRYTHCITTPEWPAGVTHCNPATQAPTEPEACPAVVPDVVEEEDPRSQDVPRMYAPSSVDVIPEKPGEKTPDTHPATPVTPVTGDVPQGSEPQIPATTGYLNGHTNGSHRRGTPPCAHVWVIEGHQSRCERCGVCCPSKG
jgi:hypothetical protein